MLTAEYESKDKLEIPGQGADFGTLIRAQAIGDVQALKAAERRVVHLEVGKIGDMLALIQELLDVVRRNQG
jgi:hypothetical protein